MRITNENDTISSQHPEYVKFLDENRLASTLMEGTSAMREAGELYLPKFPAEEKTSYSRRKASSYLNPAFSDAITKQSAKPFSRPIVIENRESLDSRVDVMIDNVDGRGTSITALGKQAFSSAATYRRVFLFTDFSNTVLPEGATRADEANAGGRPSTFIIRDVDFFNWDFAEDGSYSEIRYYTTELVPSGKFGKKRQSVIFRWFKTYWEKFIEMSDEDASEDFIELSGSKNWQLTETRSHGLGAIPIEEISLRQERTTNAELAETVLEHYQEQSDQKTIVHFSRTGVWLATGFGEDELKGFTVGPNALVEGQDSDAKLAVVEHTGSAVAIGRAELQILEDRMEALSLKPMVQRSSGDVTATEVSTNSVSACSDIRSWGILVQEGLTNCLEWAHKWVGADFKEDVKVSIYDDYSIEGSSVDKDWLLNAWSQDGISKKLFLEESKRRGMIDARVDIEEEMKVSDEQTKQKMEMAIETAKATSPAPATNGGGMQND
tara:strand:- start:3386 stop:4867 length:1482 start_codon:yes stop_codon:yes gene_type:complete